jgi:DNA-binding CsgD family transcriptional regulator
VVPRHVGVGSGRRQALASRPRGSHGHNDYVDRTDLLGREAELVALDTFLDGISSGVSGLLLEGEPGIGKTSVWQEGVRRASSRGFTVLACRPAEAEVKLSFAALADLLSPIPASALKLLPDPQRHAVEVALLREGAGSVPVEPRAVATGIGAVLDGLATAHPVLIAIDDLQWLDASSANALEFALRRVPGGIGVLATRRYRGAGGRERILRGAHRLTLGPLSLAAIHEVLKRRLGQSLPRRMLLRIHDAARGNPFYALEIAREVLETGTGPADPLPVPQNLRRLIQRRLGRLSAATRQLLLVTAALAEPTRALLSDALHEDPSAALEEAERAEVIELDGARVRFTHPLYGAAVYAAATRERRRRLHRELSEVVADPEERARHLARGREMPSVELADALEQAATLALRRGAPDAAVELTQLALERTPSTDEERRQDRALDLVERLILAADAKRARQVAREALQRLRSPERRVRALLALSELAMWSSSWSGDEDHPVVLAREALRAAGEDGALLARGHAALAETLETSPEVAVQHADRALQLIASGAAVSPAIHAQALCAYAQSRLFLGHGLEKQRLEQAIELERSRPPALVSARSRYRLGQWLKYVDDFEGSRRGLAEARQAATDEGDEFSLPNILVNLVILECWAGNWETARELGDELVQRTSELHPTQSAAPHVALRAALTGDVEMVRGLLRLAPMEGVYDVIRLRPLGLLALSEGKAAAAFAYLGPAVSLMDGAGVKEPAVFRIHADAVEAAVGAGRLTEAIRLKDVLDEQARASAIPWDVMAAARSSALIAAAEGDLETALAAAEHALHACDHVPMPFELARTLLVKGQIERRAKRRGTARTSLDRALAIFDRLGARLWSERARQEIDRLGARRTTSDELTETQRRVAELSAVGLTNRQVADQLFMSPKTVEANLDRIYRKLGIRSRAELGARLGAASQASERM